MSLASFDRKILPRSPFGVQVSAACAGSTDHASPTQRTSRIKLDIELIYIYSVTLLTLIPELLTVFR